MTIQLSRFVLLLFIFTTSIVENTAQNNPTAPQDYSRFIIKEGGFYSYEGDVYDYEELVPLFNNCSEAMIFRQLSADKDRLVKRSNYMMAFSGGMTIILFGLANRQIRGTPGYDNFFNTGIVILSLNLFIFPYNMAQKIFSSRYKNESILSFNGQEIMQNGYDRDASYLQLGVTGNGVGLVYSF